DRNGLLFHWCRLRLFGRHVLRLLVAPQAQIAAMADAAFRRELGKGDLRHELRRQPGDAARLGTFDFHRRALALERFELCCQLLESIAVEASADPALVDQLAAFMLRQRDRGEGAPLGRALGPADDYEFL